jgi:flagellar motor switch protein FliN/FliY
VSLTVDNKLIARGELIETEEGGLGVKITEIAEDPDATGT